MSRDLIADGWRLQHPYSGNAGGHPNRTQWEILSDADSDFIVVHGGKGSGKTHGAIEGFVWNELVVWSPGCQMLGVGLDMPSMLLPDSMIPGLRECMRRTSWVSPEGVEHPWQEGTDWLERQTSPRSITLPYFGSQITLVPSESTIRAGSFSKAWIDEGGLFKFDSFADVIGRLRSSTGNERTLVTTTPEKQNPRFIKWVHENFYANPKPGWRAIRASTRDAHYLAGSYIENMKMVYSAEAQRAYIDGELLLSAGGGVYSTWTDRCVWRPGDARPEPTCRGDEPLHISPDWGGPNMAVVLSQLWPWPMNDVGALRVVIAEFDLGQNATSRRYGEAVGEYIASRRWHVGRKVIITGDPQGGATNLGVGVTRLGEFMAGLRSKGIEAAHRPPKTCHVGDRIEVVRNVLEKERVMVHHRCVRLIADRSEVQWTRSGETLDKGKDGAQTHFSDADDYDILTYWGVPDRKAQHVIYGERDLLPHERAQAAADEAADVLRRFGR